MIKAIITDIEGTTTSIHFVVDTLFPYARAHLAEYIRHHLADQTVAGLLENTRQLAGEPQASPQRTIEILTQWIDEDRKATPLKTLQGLIWASGYEQGQLKSHVYQDAYEQLSTWHAQGIQLYVYSSGSVLAQKLLFKHSPYGDLDQWFSGNFDTRIGHKQDPVSYQNILNHIHHPSREVLFLSDIPAELDAAAQAGIKTLGLNRECFTHDYGRHTVTTDFRQIDLNNF